MASRPLRIEWKLSRPVIARQRDIHLDALLDWAAVQENDGDWRIPRQLPLQSYQVGDESVFKASVVVFNQTAPARLQHMLRRTSPPDMVRDIERGVFEMRGDVIDTASGPLKGYSWFAHTQPCSSAVAWCIGNEDRIVELLGRVRSLGKLARNSMGLVSEFSVLPAPSDEADNWMLRAMPEGFAGTSDAALAEQNGITYARALGRLQAPYWLPEKSVVLEPIEHACA